MSDQHAGASSSSEGILFPPGLPNLDFEDACSSASPLLQATTKGSSGEPFLGFSLSLLGPHAYSRVLSLDQTTLCF